jgi:hypothetical protein
MVDVARNTSMITTTAFRRSYKCNNAGERQVYSVGLLFAMRRKNKKEQ